MKSRSVFEMVRIGADLIIFAIALASMFFFVAKMSEVIDVCMPQTEIMRVR